MMIRGGSSLYAASVAIYEKLAAVFAATSVSVFDGFIPEEKTEVNFPYIIVGEMAEAQSNLLARAVRQTVVTIKVYTLYRGTKQAKQIASQIIDTLEEIDLAPEEGWVFPKVRYLDTNILQEDDTRFTAVVRFEITAERMAVVTT